MILLCKKITTLGGLKEMKEKRRVGEIRSGRGREKGRMSYERRRGK